MTTTIHHNLDELDTRIHLVSQASDALKEAYKRGEKAEITRRLTELTNARNRLNKWDLFTDRRETPVAA